MQDIGGLDLGLLETIFDRLPDCPIFIKNRDLKYVSINLAMVQLCNADSRNEMVGKTVYDYFPAHQAARYEAMDRDVLRTGRPVVDRLEPAFASNADSAWLFFSRIPIMDRGNAPVGIIGMARQYRPSERDKKIFERLKKIVSAIEDNFDKPLNLSTLAQIGGVSKSQIERDFKNLFHLTPQQYLHRTRLDRALRLLQTKASISTIAHKCGYADHSAFSRRFKVAMGMTPKSYRQDLVKNLSKA